MELKGKVLGFWGKKGGVPDVGQERAEASSSEQLIGAEGGGDDVVDEGSAEVVEEKVAPVKKASKVIKSKISKKKKGGKSKKSGRAALKSVESSAVSGSTGNLEAEKIKGKIEMLDSLIKGVNERLSVVGQQVGEVRNMSIGNEKLIVKSGKDALRAVDIVKEVKPEELRVAYQKMDLKIQTLNEKLEANKEFNDSLMAEVKELKGKAGLFVGTEGVLKLNEDVKKDLVEVQKMASKVRLNADKSEQIFMEIRKGFAESQKSNKIIGNLDSSYSGLREQIEKLKVDYSSLVSYKDYNDNQKKMDSNFATLEESLNSVEVVKKNNERLTAVIEKVFVLAKNNEKDVENLAVTLGDTKVKRASDYEERFRLLLDIVEDASEELAKVKKKVGMKRGKALSKKVVLEKEKVAKLAESEDVNSKDVVKKTDIVEQKDLNKEVSIPDETKKKKSFFKKLFNSKWKEDSPLEADKKKSEVPSTAVSEEEKNVEKDEVKNVEKKVMKEDEVSSVGPEGVKSEVAPVESKKTKPKVEKSVSMKRNKIKVKKKTKVQMKKDVRKKKEDGKVHKAPERIKGEKKISDLKKKKEATIKGINKGYRDKKSKINEGLKGMRGEIKGLKKGSNLQEEIKSLEGKLGIDVKKKKKKKLRKKSSSLGKKKKKSSRVVKKKKSK